MKAHNCTFILVVIFIAAGSVQAAGDWDIYSDAMIEEGDDYWTVRVFDSPPDHTTVDMTGGSANVIQAYDASTFNMTGGVTEVSAHDESTINMGGGTIYTLRADESSTANVFGGFVNSLQSWDTGIVNVWGNANVDVIIIYEHGFFDISGGVIDHIAVREFGVLNMSGGSVYDRLSAVDSSEVNIYGYDLTKTNTGGSYGYGQVYGFWPNDIPFTFDLNGADTFNHINLIPEPGSFVLISVGILFLRNRKDKYS